MLLGQADDSKAYKLCDSGFHKVIVARDVMFDESCTNVTQSSAQDVQEVDFVLGHETCISLDDVNEVVRQPLQNENPDSEPSHIPSTSVQSSDDESDAANEKSPEPSVPPVAEPPPLLRRSTHVRKTPLSWWKDLFGTNTQTKLPSNYKQEVARSRAAFWKTDVEKQLASQAKNETWKLVERTAAMNVLTSRWMVTTKQVQA